MMVTCSALRWKDDARLMTMRWLLGGLIILLTPGGAQARGQAHPARAEGWAEAQPLPAPRERGAVAVGRDGSIYVFGGDSSGKYYNTTFIYHSRANRWSTGAPLPTARFELGAAALPDGRIYTVGGVSASGFMATVEAYNPLTDRWSSAVPLPQPRCCLGVAALPSGDLYVIGGGSGAGISDQVLTLHIAASPGLVAATTPTPGDYRGVPLGSGQRLRSSDDGYPHEKEQWHA